MASPEIKPIVVWLTPSGPNPWKVVLVLEAMRCPYEIKSISFPETKTKPFIEMNINGKVPAIEDPNTGLVLWESGAIIQYLVRQYDAERRVSFDPHTQVKDAALCEQWLMFQMSGQGPYYGQCSWFHVLHAEDVPSARKRYLDEVHRILSVLETALQITPGQNWLVGDKMTYVDLAFMPWNVLIPRMLGSKADPDDPTKLLNTDLIDAYPAVKAWHERMLTTEAFEKAWAKRDECMEAQGIDPATGLPKGTNVQEAMQSVRS